MSLVAYRRAGGRPPPDDEELVVEDDGACRARRTVGGARIGRFESRLGAPALRRLRDLAERAAVAGDLAVRPPRDAALETVTALDGRASMGSNERPDGPWRPLVERLRALADGDALRDPVAALTLEAGRDSARLSHAGAEALAVDAGSLAVRAVRLDGQGLVLGRWQSAPDPAAPDAAVPREPAWVAAAPGWRLDIPLPHGLGLVPGDWLQVWLFLSVRDVSGDGAERDCRLFAAVPG